jgi:hypothetical protein
MIEFSHWDIIRHLCKGGAWSAGLSLIAWSISIPKIAIGTKLSDRPCALSF